MDSEEWAGTCGEFSECEEFWEHRTLCLGEMKQLVIWPEFLSSWGWAEMLQHGNIFIHNKIKH